MKASWSLGVVYWINSRHNIILTPTCTAVLMGQTWCFFCLFWIDRSRMTEHRQIKWKFLFWFITLILHELLNAGIWCIDDVEQMLLSSVIPVSIKTFNCLSSDPPLWRDRREQEGTLRNLLILDRVQRILAGGDTGNRSMLQELDIRLAVF